MIYAIILLLDGSKHRCAHRNLNASAEELTGYAQHSVDRTETKPILGRRDKETTTKRGIWARYKSREEKQQRKYQKIRNVSYILNDRPNDP